MQSKTGMILFAEIILNKGKLPYEMIMLEIIIIWGIIIANREAIYMELFFDRESEMETLQREYDRKGSSLVLMYGRRRVGKTTLISEFIKEKGRFFSCQRRIRNTEPK